MAKSIIRLGSTGDTVLYLQQSLTKLGYNSGSIDGIFGSKTQTAVKAFQKDKGLVVDGIVGNSTWTAIDNALQNPQTPIHPMLSIGSIGDSVRYLQVCLDKLGYKPAQIDGIFGSKTETAVKAFQKAKGLVVDGIVGEKTWLAIDKSV